MADDIDEPQATDFVKGRRLLVKRRHAKSIQRDWWEYRMFNVEDGRVMETLARKGVEGWQAFHLEDYVGVKSRDMVRIYCKRKILASHKENTDG